jgi:hypothetical protein
MAEYRFEHEKPEERWHSLHSRSVAGYRFMERLEIWLRPLENQRPCGA